MADNVDELFPEPAQAEEETPAPEVTEAQVPEPVAEETPEPIVEDRPRGAEFVPIDAMLTERERRQAAERELAQYRNRQPETQAAPDPFDDPKGYDAFVEQRIEARLQQQKVETSYHLAVRDHGKDDVEAARTWALEKAQKDPVFGQQIEAAFKSESLPLDWVVQQHKRDAMLSTIGDRSMDDFVRDYLTKNPGLIQSAPAPTAPVAVTPASPPVKVPRSLATQGSGPSDIRQVASGPLAGVDALFN